MSSKTKKTGHIKRQGLHHKHSKPYKQVYWPYMPLLCLSLVIFVASLLPPTFRGGKTLAYTRGLSLNSLLEATNVQRQTNEARPLQLNQQLTQAAQAKANDMATRNYWSHQTPEGDEPWTFIRNAGYQYSYAGENLAYGFSNSKTTVDGWMNSQSHRENLLNPDFTEAGFGFADVANYQKSGESTVVVAMYGRPAVLAVPAPVEPTPSPPTTTLASTQVQTVTRVQSIFGLSSVWSGMVVGLLAGGAIVGLFLNHGLRLRRLLTRGEQYFVAHPLFDVSLILLIISAINFSRVIGHIH